MWNFIDRSDLKYGRLLAMNEARTKWGRLAWKCLCDCWKIIIVESSALWVWNSTSCGCLRKESTKNNWKNFYKHWETHTPIWNSWDSMIRRTNHSKRYKNVEVCKEWLVYENYRDWALVNSYKEWLTLDRIKNNLWYFPWNCRFATAFEQAINRGTTKLTWEKVNKIRELIKKEVKPKLIAEEFWISTWTVSDLKCNRRWKI